MTPSPLVFVGIGAIGLPMAARIAAAGHTVTGVDTAPGAADRAKEAGLAAAVPAIGAAPADATTTIVMVATPDQLGALVDDALAARPDQAGRHWVIMSTVGPDAVRAQTERLAAAGARVVDAPVTGGVARARTGELTIFAAGAADDVAAVAPILSPCGTVRTVGERAGDGQAIKVVNQHLCSVHIVAAAEALNLASSLDLDPAQVLGLIEGGAAGSYLLSDRGPRMLGGTDVEVTSAVSIFVKDSGLVAEAARSADAATPLLDLARDRYLAAADRGLAAHDDSRVIETYQTP
ncbi:MULTISPECIES: NAD(P)-dependent oxidoreductase [unclassified Streptomyces]|uniref:NAD(P)-dependent oxidoreductase n=1 Tax=unclassified Streptomyces TaxID=2593676 RepID=UPI00278C0C49|nr:MULTISPECIES: NAD(P)-dependent oxidoreductase [unclassified Streptomyces]